MTAKSTKATKKTSSARKPNNRTTRDIEQALAAAEQHIHNLNVYEVYCAGYARQMQHNDVADLVMPFSCAYTAAAFGLGLEHAKRGTSLCRLDDVVDAVVAYTSQPSK